MRTAGTTPRWRRHAFNALTAAAGGTLCLTLMAQGEGTIYKATTTHNCKQSLRTARVVTATWATDGTLLSLSTNTSGKRSVVTKMTVEQNDEKLGVSASRELEGDFVATVSGAAPADGANVTLDIQPIGQCSFTAKPKAEDKK